MLNALNKLLENAQMPVGRKKQHLVNPSARAVSPVPLSCLGYSSSNLPKQPVPVHGCVLSLCDINLWEVGILPVHWHSALW